MVVATFILMTLPLIPEEKLVMYKLSVCLLILLPLFLICDGQAKFPIFQMQEAPFLFQKFMKRYDKKYNNEWDYQNRYLNFVNTLRKVNEINAEPGSVKVVPNKYADLSDQERSLLEEEQTTKRIDSELAALSADRDPKVLDIIKYDLRK